MHAASTWLYAVATSGYSARDLVERALPQVAGEREHVRLVHEREVLAAAAPRQVEGVAHAALDADAGVDRALRRDLVRRALAEEPALAGVGALGVLADDDEVDASAAATNGRRLTYRSSSKRIFSSSPRSSTPGGTSGVPTAPSRSASKPAQLVEHRVGQHLARRAGSGRRRGRSRRCRADARGARRP